MKKLRSSYSFKILCAFLSLLFLIIFVFNVALIIFAYSQNLIFANKNSIEQKIYSHLAERTTNDVIRYYNYKFRSDMDGTAGNYWYNESELYRSSYSKENCNIGFELKDESGNILLKNYDVSDIKFSFETPYKFSFDSEYIEEGTTILEGEESDSEELTPTPTENNASAGEEDDTNTNLTYSISYKRYGITHNFIYHFNGEQDSDILEYCNNDMLRQVEAVDYSSNSEEVIDYNYYQTDYAVSSDGIVFEKAHSSYNDDDVDFSYVPVSHVYTVSIYVPEIFNDEVKDIYYYAEKTISNLLDYKSVIIPVTIICFVSAFLCYAWLLYSAGYKRNNEQPYLGGLHRIPFDLLCFIMVVFFVLTFAAFFSDYIKLLFLPGAVLSLSLALFTIESLAARLHAHAFIRNNVTHYIFRLNKKLYSSIKKSIKSAAEHTDFLWKAVIAYAGITVLELIAIVLVDSSSHIWSGYNYIIPTFVLPKIFVLTPLAVVVSVNLSTLQKGAKSLAKGDFKRIDGPLLFGEFKRNAAYLNSIGESVDRAVNERVQSESMKTELITNVSHDLKTPLTSIVNYIDLLKKLEINDVKAAEYIDVIDRQSQRLKKLTVDIVEASKASTGNIEVTKELIEMNVLLEQVSGEYSEKLKEKNLIPVVECFENKITVSADGRLLWRVLDNLMNNICKYSMPGTRVYISLRRELGKARIMFRNISSSELNITPEDLTERFVRGDKSRNTEGSGLGLSIAKSLTELMGGIFRISIDGDLFKVMLEFDALPDTPTPTQNDN